MSCNYADGLSPYANKGKCGLPERFDSDAELAEKIERLAKFIENSKHVVVYTGAGISTSAGIPDFRGPRGVWTREERGQSPPPGVQWHEALPTVTHMALVALVRSGYVRAVVTQNIDGLHLRSGLPRSKLSELHGNVLTHRCASCGRQFVRAKPVPTVGERCLGLPCPATRPRPASFTNVRRRSSLSSERSRLSRCRGRLHDVVLDWEAALPEDDLRLAELHSTAADLALCLGTTLQIVPSGDLPTYVKRRNNGRLVICNLQPTKHDRRADLIIAAYVDRIMCKLLVRLGVSPVEYSELEDPMKMVAGDASSLFEWTLPVSALTDPDLLLSVRCVREDLGRLKRSRVSRKRKCDGISNHNCTGESDPHVKTENTSSLDQGASNKFPSNKFPLDDVGKYSTSDCSCRAGDGNSDDGGGGSECYRCVRTDEIKTINHSSAHSSGFCQRDIVPDSVNAVSGGN